MTARPSLKSLAAVPEAEIRPAGTPMPIICRRTASARWLASVAGIDLGLQRLRQVLLAIVHRVPDQAASERAARQADQRAGPWVAVKATLEVGYTLVDSRSGQAVLRRKIATEKTVTVGEAVVGMDRVRLAIEGAARQNIEQFIAETSKLRLD